MPARGVAFCAALRLGHSNTDWTASRLGIVLAAEELQIRAWPLLAPFDDYPAGATRAANGPCTRQAPVPLIYPQSRLGLLPSCPSRGVRECRVCAPFLPFRSLCGTATLYWKRTFLKCLLDNNVRLTIAARCKWLNGKKYTTLPLPEHDFDDELVTRMGRSRYA